MKFEKDSTQNVFIIAESTVNFSKMTETIGGDVRKIKREEDTQVRVRPTDSERVHEAFTTKERRKNRNFDKTSFEWLAQNYTRKKGLRKWTWRVIIEGIKSEHIHHIKKEGKKSELDASFVNIIWDLILKFGGVIDLDKVPELTDPNHRDVKLILTIYSLESFLFKRVNECCRLQETSVIDTLGPYSVALTKVI